MRRRRALWPLAAALLASACAPDPPCGLRACDIRDAACQRMAAAAAACLRGVDPVDVPVSFVSRADFLAHAATPLTPAEETTFQRWNAGLATLGLAPADNTPAADSAASASQVGGVYSPIDKRITIVDDGVPLDDWPGVGLLVHENAHAIQDARFDLGQLSASRDTDIDHALALGSVSEGEATYVQDLADAGFFGVDAAGIPWPRVLERWQASARMQAYVTPLPVSLAWLHFRYPFGTAFVKGALDASDWAGVDALFAAPPSGTREVLAGFGAAEPAGGLWAEDLGPDAVPVLGDGYDYAGTDRLGAWLLGAFLDRIGDVDGARQLPPLLRGDALSIFQDRSTGGAVAIWRLRLAVSASSSVLNDVLLSRLLTTRVDDVGDDIVIVAASDTVTLNAVPFAPPYRARPNGPTKPLPGAATWGCALPVR